MVTIPSFYLIKKIILITYASLSEDKDKILFYSLDIFRAKFILDSIGDIFCIISNLIYLEILELNFCNLNYNLRITIIERGLLDSYGDNENDLFIEDNDQKQEESTNEDIKILPNFCFIIYYLDFKYYLLINFLLSLFKTK